MTVSRLLKTEAAFRAKIDARLKECRRQSEFDALWEEGRPEIVDDGCLDAQQYLNSFRILWVLKEHNGQTPIYGSAYAKRFAVSSRRRRVFWDLHTDSEGFAGNVNKYRSLKLIEVASRGILTRNPKVNAGGDVTGTAVETFRKLAFVEVGKTIGGASTSPARLNALVSAWGDIVIDEMRAYGPNLVIVAGSHFLLLEKRMKGLTGGNLKYSHGGETVCRYDWSGVPVLWADHPAWRGATRQDWVAAVVEAGLAARRLSANVG